MPARSKAQSATIVTDLDALISKPIAFKFQNEIFTVKPVDTGTFLKVAASLGDLQALLSREDPTQTNREEIDEKYFNLLSVLCEDLTLAHIQRMTVAQINALLRLVVRHLTGDTEKFMQATETDSTEKKNQVS